MSKRRLTKLNVILLKHSDANVNVNLKIYNDKKAKVEITIPMQNLVLRAEEVNDDMYAGIDLITDKLERQIRKHKTKVNRKIPRKRWRKCIVYNGCS